MKRILLLLSLLYALALPLCAQTVIDLRHGGVRAKTVDDYREESGVKERLRRDSLDYIDHLTRAFNALRRDSLDAAARLFHLALKKRPDAPGNYVVRYNLGQIALSQGKLREATELFTAVLKERPATHDARYARAACLYEAGSTAAALEDCTALLAADLLPDDLRVRTLFLRSAVHSAERRPDAARLDLEEILRCEPDNESASLLLAGVYEELGRQNEALDRLNRFLVQHPGHYDGLMARAALEERLSMDRPARSDYDEAIRCRPDSAEAYVGRARVLLRLGLPGAARKDLDEAARLGYPHTALAELYRRLKN